MELDSDTSYLKQAEKISNDLLEKLQNLNFKKSVSHEKSSRKLLNDDIKEVEMAAVLENFVKLREINRNCCLQLNAMKQHSSVEKDNLFKAEIRYLNHKAEAEYLKDSIEKIESQRLVIFYFLPF
ncbi:hypothetical protein AYI68_g4446 [Smittium mucronatum]|uniref:Uncharacterized protein n=1 Tax=Smittium mucronatum TaxID=133383 RepID=A0A1R0GX26_9FUNG|nr:hypothetical protein AYI68_g4446 [Smittium mucronatum]